MTTLSIDLNNLTCEELIRLGVFLAKTHNGFDAYREVCEYLGAANGTCVRRDVDELESIKPHVGMILQKKWNHLDEVDYAMIVQVNNKYYPMSVDKDSIGYDLSTRRYSGFTYARGVYDFLKKEGYEQTTLTLKELLTISL